MTIQAVGRNQVMNFCMSNPIRSTGLTAITMVALNAIQRLGVSAKITPGDRFIRCTDRCRNEAGNYNINWDWVEKYPSKEAAAEAEGVCMLGCALRTSTCATFGRYNLPTSPYPKRTEQYKEAGLIP